MKFINRKYVNLQSILLLICLMFTINVLSLIISNKGCADSTSQMIYRGLIDNAWSRIKAGSMLSDYLHQQGYTSNEYSVIHKCLNISSLKNNTTYTAMIKFDTEPQNAYQYNIQLKSGTINQVPDIPVDDNAITLSKERLYSETGRHILELVQYLYVNYHYQESDYLSMYASISGSLYTYSVVFKDEPYIRYNFVRNQSDPSGSLHFQDYLLLKKSTEYTDTKHKFAKG